MLQNRKTAVRASFVLFQLAAIIIALNTRDIITISHIWPKQYTEEYLRWWFYEYNSSDEWYRIYDLFIAASSLLFPAAIGAVAETAHRRGELSTKEMLLCFIPTCVSYVLMHCALCLLFEHYYRYWHLLLPEFLSIALLVLSEIIERNRRKSTKLKKDI